MENAFKLNAPFNPETQETIQKLQDFSKSAAMVSSSYQRLIEEYESQWIGVYLETIVANAGTLDELIEKLKEKKIPPGETVVQFITEEQQTLIL